VSGIFQSGVPEDEGQHVQSVYKPARFHGGPGKYIFDEKSYMNEHHALANDQSASAIMEQWAQYFDPTCHYYIEKSPPNLIRTRFLQRLFPKSKFIVILRHPVAVSYATQKWSRTSIRSLVEHSLRGYEIFMKDISHLRHVYVLRYEDFVYSPQDEINKIYDFLDLEPILIQHEIHSNVNEKYFSMWEASRSRIVARLTFPVSNALEKRMNMFGYSIRDCRKLLATPLLGAHEAQVAPAAGKGF
jgi:hypothetical protein